MSDKEKCVCGHWKATHIGCEYLNCPCLVYRPAKETPPVCTVDEQQCDAECQTRPDRKCAEEPKPAESVYERARWELDAEECDCEICEDWCRHELTLAALDAGEAAEKRAGEAEDRVRDLERYTKDDIENIKSANQNTRALLDEQMARASKMESTVIQMTHLVEEQIKSEQQTRKVISDALALLKPARPEDGLLPAVRDVMQRLALAESELEELRKDEDRDLAINDTAGRGL